MLRENILIQSKLLINLSTTLVSSWEIREEIPRGQVQPTQLLEEMRSWWCGLNISFQEQKVPFSKIKCLKYFKIALSSDQFQQVNVFS